MGSQVDIGMVKLHDATKEVIIRKSRDDVVTAIKDKRKRPKFIENNPVAWAKRHGINCRECTQFIAKNTTTEDPECQCGYPISQHAVDAVGAAPSEGAAWNVSDHTRAIPTNAVGEMEFVNYGQKSAKYIRVDTDTPPEQVWNLLTRVWKLKPPHLVISVTGGAKSFRLSPRLKEVFRKGLVKAAINTDAWITSGGTNTGVMKYVGEAIRDLAMGQPSPVVALGIATWGCIMGKESLVNPRGIARYRIGPAGHGAEAPIDCNHSHIILVDNGTQHHFGVEIDFRAKLEKTIAEKSNAKGSIILVVVEGGPGTLETVYQSVYQQNIPALIIGGSGRAADILAYAYEISEETILDETDHDGRTHTNTVKVLDDDALVKLQTRLGETFRGSKHSKILEYISWIKDCLLFPHLLSIFQIDRDNNAKDIDLAILKALLKANQEAAVDQLRLSLIWNRVDVAAADIYSDDKTFAEDDLNELMLTAIQLDRVDFVKLFLQSGFSLRDFLTEETLLRLYMTASKRSTLYWQLRKLKRKNKGLCSRGGSGEPEMEKLTLTDIGHLVESLMGSHYLTQYTRAYSLGSAQMTSTRRRKNPAGDLFNWCILMARSDMAKVFWEEGKDSLAAALTGHGLLKAIHRRTQDNELKQKLQQDALDFRQLAIGVLNTCYDDSDEKTARILLRTSEFWGQTSCINIAVGSKNKEFIALKACQDLFKKIWWGYLEPSNGYWVFPSALFPPLIPFFLSFKRIEDESYDPSRNDGSLGQTTIVQNESVDLVPRTNSLNIGRKYVEFFKAPVTKFCYNAIAFVLLLLLYSYVMLIEFYSDGVRIPEMVLVAWVSSILCEELRQFWRASTGSFGSKVSYYFSDRWNILDMLTLLLFFVGFTLRFFQETFVAARLVLSINVFGFFVRLLHIFSVSKLMGPKLVMISKMMWDLVSFMGIMLVFIVGYAISSQSILYPNTTLHPSIIIDVFRKAYWQIFAELFLEEIEGQDITDCVDGYRMLASGATERCPTDVGKVAVPILLAFYMLITNVLLLNLLIAMFSNTFTMVQDQADLHWHFQLYKLTQEFENRPILPPPFIVLAHLYRTIRACGKKTLGGPAGFLPDTDDYTSEEERYLDIFEENRRDEYMFEQKKKMMDTTDFRVKSTVDKMDNLVLKVDDIQRSKSRIATEAHAPEAEYGQLYTSANEELGFLKDQVGTLKSQLAKTNEALEWIMVALRDSKITPGQSEVELLRMPSIKEEGDANKQTPRKKKAQVSRQLSIDRLALVHSKSLCSPYPGTDVRRLPVAPEQMSWQVSLPRYSPPFFTDPTVMESPTWADEPSLVKDKVSWNKYDDNAKVNRSSYDGEYSMKGGVPLNPRGRTGLQGRGLLGRWGPNHAADPIVTRWKRGKDGCKLTEDGRPVLEYVAARRKDNKQFSFPGGLILPGETFDEAVRRNFVEEALSNLLEDEDEATRMEPILSKLFSKGIEVYTGYVDDTRNTDNAWIETRAVNYHDEDGSLTSQLRLQPGKTEDGIAWLTVCSKMPLHANHIIILEKVADLHQSDF